MIDNFTSYSPNNYKSLFKVDNLPIFTQKTYNSYIDAINCQTGIVNLVQSTESGFVYNIEFNPDLMIYDENYNNEQGFSKFFLDHLSKVSQLILNEVSIESKIIEIGCGKGLFLNIIKKLGYDITGFDPTYEGNDESIVKDYFSEKYNTNADFLILRHTLEHIKDPFTFLHLIAKANNYKGKIYIEVPTFEWISERSSFWDITYEHCNYFTEYTLTSFFQKSKSGKLFGDQYIYIIADLSDLNDTINEVEVFNVSQVYMFNEKVKYYNDFLSKLDSIAIWGGATKSLLFLNQCDPNKQKIEFVIDINPAKQNKFMAKTGHEIFSPDILKKRKIKNIIVANENYFDEIKYELKDYKINLYKLQ
jgi:hypothetical protein